MMNYSLLTKATRRLLSRFVSFSENWKKKWKTQKQLAPKKTRGLISEYWINFIRVNLDLFVQKQFFSQKSLKQYARLAFGRRL